MDGFVVRVTKKNVEVIIVRQTVSARQDFVFTIRSGDDDISPWQITIGTSTVLAINAYMLTVATFLQSPMLIFEVTTTLITYQHLLSGLKTKLQLTPSSVD